MTTSSSRPRGRDVAQADYDQFVREKFADDWRGLADFYCYLRKDGFGTDDFYRDFLEVLYAQWSRSRRRGKHSRPLDRERRSKFGPGKFWADSSAGVYLNKRFVKGWRGINPENP